MTTDQDLESHLTLVYHHEVIDIRKHPLRSYKKVQKANKITLGTTADRYSADALVSYPLPHRTPMEKGILIEVDLKTIHGWIEELASTCRVYNSRAGVEDSSYISLPSCSDRHKKTPTTIIQKSPEDK